MRGWLSFRKVELFRCICLTPYAKTAEYERVGLVLHAVVVTQFGPTTLVDL